jgi:hypothetical protein
MTHETMLCDASNRVGPCPGGLRKVCVQTQRGFHGSVVIIVGAQERLASVEYSSGVASATLLVVNVFDGFSQVLPGRFVMAGFVGSYS